MLTESQLWDYEIELTNREDKIQYVQNFLQTPSSFYDTSNWDNAKKYLEEGNLDLAVGYVKEEMYQLAHLTDR